MLMVFLDESGDLGWTLDAPYRQGGSSRFLTIAHVMAERQNSKYIGRLVKDVYTSKNKTKNQELKACHLDSADRITIANKTVNLISQGRIEIHAITVKKDNVSSHLHADSNLLYNYMIKQCIFDRISLNEDVHIVPDNRSIKVKYAHAIETYLKLALIEKRYETKLAYTPKESHADKGIQFADYIANIIWRRHEFGDEAAYQIIHGHIRHKKLFFRKPRNRSERRP